MPSGVYKLSREAILTAALPMAFTTRTNWKGSSPREMLCMFCRHHWLSEPVFSTFGNSLKESLESSGFYEKLPALESAERKKECTNGGGTATSDKEPVRCEVKIFSKSLDLILECSPKEIYKKHSESIENASLKVLSWLNAFLKDPDVPLEKLNNLAVALDIQFHPQNLFKKFSSCLSIHNVLQRKMGENLLQANSINMLNAIPEHGICCLSIGGPDSGICPSTGCLSFISYSVSLVVEAETMKELLESREEFEFEMGTGAVIPHVEVVTAQMSVGQSACFCKDLPPQELILAAADDFARAFSLISSSEFTPFVYVNLRECFFHKALSDNEKLTIFHEMKLIKFLQFRISLVLSIQFRKCN